MSPTALRGVYLALAAAVIVFDQGSKQWAAAVLREGPDVTLIDGFLKLTYAENPGIAFSFFNSGAQTTRWALAAFSTVAAIGVLVYALRLDAKLHRLQVTFALLFGGIVGNLIDRAATGRVIDFIDAYYATSHWPTFNIADSAISAGAVLLAWELFFGEENASSKTASQGSDTTGTAN